jgi:hypothetical protein
MQRKSLLLFPVLACCFMGFCNAQSLASAENSTLHFTSTEIPPSNSDNWTFYLDAESQVYYIDFENISVNLSDIMVKDKTGAVVKRDELWDLPVNTIYELDLKDLQPGSYEIELRTYTSVIKKEVTVSR